MQSVRPRSHTAKMYSQHPSLVIYVNPINSSSDSALPYYDGNVETPAAVNLIQGTDWQQEAQYSSAPSASGVDNVLDLENSRYRLVKVTTTARWDWVQKEWIGADVGLGYVKDQGVCFFTAAREL